MPTRTFLSAAALLLGGAAPSLAEAAWMACVANVPPGDVLNVRERPTTRSPVVGIFHRDGCDIRIESCEGNWCYTANHEFSGYVSRAYLRRQGGTAGACGWYVALGCSQSPSGARRILSKLGGAGAGAHVVDNADLPNFTPGWWCVVDGPHRSRARADRTMWEWTDAVPDAYVKSGC